MPSLLYNRIYLSFVKNHRTFIKLSQLSDSILSLYDWNLCAHFLAHCIFIVLEIKTQT